ncbi:diadenosine tetraphosphate (Ap4A) HIT family hydrolase [Stella humosa]|uniref:Diadenosine tetraphosphate (Ap4A) HIT family hydrolase n=2 Tax=Stella humosa TaxID=94 RepID=A0A3N1KWM6_9PROT|nr:diadenosine tetraphosphate (Ap4A) HIT family hydrolase [Stella humosa]
MFTLDPRLEGDTIPVIQLGLSTVLLMDEPAWPWLILVPMRADVRELTDLSADERQVLIEEIALAERVLARLHRPDKLNVGALGNMVPQLHIHVIARHTTDPAWPRPVWGAVERTRHPPAAAADMVAALRTAFAAEARSDG